MPVSTGKHALQIIIIIIIYTYFDLQSSRRRDPTQVIKRVCKWQTLKKVFKIYFYYSDFLVTPLYEKLTVVQHITISLQTFIKGFKSTQPSEKKFIFKKTYIWLWWQEFL